MPPTCQTAGLHALGEDVVEAEEMSMNDNYTTLPSNTLGIAGDKEVIISYHKLS